MKLKFALLFLAELLIKWLCDISKFRWERSWLSEIGWLDAWKNLPLLYVFGIQLPPMDLWHILSGLLYMTPFAMFMWFYFEGWFVPFNWKWKHKLSYIGILIVIWIVFFGLFHYGYHYFLMRPEWWGK